MLEKNTSYPTFLGMFTQEIHREFLARLSRHAAISYLELSLTLSILSIMKLAETRIVQAMLAQFLPIYKDALIYPSLSGLA